MGLFDDVINQNTTTAKPKSASKKQSPKILLEGELGKSLSQVIKCKEDLALAKDGLAIAAADVIGACQERQDNDAFAGNFVGSYDVSNKKGESIKFVTTDSFSVPQDEDSRKAIEKVVGKVKFEKIFEETSCVMLKGEVFKDEALQKEFLAIVGKDNFSKFFVNVKKLKTKKGLKEKLHNYFDEEKLEDFRALVSQNTPSLK